MRNLLRIFATVLAAGLLSYSVCWADIPPPLKFTASSKFGKSDAALVVRADAADGSSGYTERSGAGYDTQEYCSAVLDFEIGPRAKGVFKVHGRAIALSSVGIGAPAVDEAPPMEVVGSNTGWRAMTVSVQLRHNVTEFEYEPSAHSKGPVYVWATAIPCAMGTRPFAPPVH